MMISLSNKMKVWSSALRNPAVFIRRGFVFNLYLFTFVIAECFSVSFIVALGRVTVAAFRILVIFGG